MFKVDWDDAAVVAGIGRLNAVLKNPSAIHAQIAELLLVQTRERFGKAVSPEGVPWAAKSKATIDAQRRANGRASTKPLIGPSRRLSNEIIALHDASYAAVGSNMIQAAVMQWGVVKGAFGKTARGSSIPWGNIPGRPFLGVGPADGEQIVNVLSAWLAQVVAGNARA